MKCKNCQKQTSNTNTCQHCGHCPKCGALTYNPIHECVMKRLTLPIILLLFAVLACGMPVSTLSPVTVNKEVHIITPTLEPAPTPFRTDAESTSRACGSLWVREGAGVEYQQVAWALKGDTLYLTGEYREASDGGKWMKVLDRDGLIGWVNSKLICGGEE